jgi:hypothetical protein
MYCDSFKWDVDDWELNMRAFQFGPAMALALLYKGQSDCPQALLSIRKGRPVFAEPSQNDIRSLCGASDRLFNILHTPEDQEGAHRELEMWFERKCLDKLTTGSECISNRIIEEEIENHGYLRDRELDGLAQRICLKLRILHAIERQVFAPEETSNDVKCLRVLYREALAEIRPLKPQDVRRRELLGRVRREETALAKSLLTITKARLATHKYHSVHQLIRVSRDIDTDCQYPRRALAFLWQQLLELQIYVSELEKLLITISVMYPSRFDQQSPAHVD